MAVPEHLTYFGSGNSLETSYELARAWFDDHVKVIPPMVPGYGDGEQIVYDDEAEAEKVSERISMLEDLMDLKHPVYYTDWGYSISAQMCPCGVSGEEWLRREAMYDDPLGDWHGRNE